MTNSNFCSWENGEILWGQEVCTLIHTQNEERQTNWHVYTEGLPVVLPWIFGNHLGGQYKSVKQRCNIKIRLFCNRKTLPQILPSLTKLETAILYKCCHTATGLITASTICHNLQCTVSQIEIHSAAPSSLMYNCCYFTTLVRSKCKQK